MTDHDDLLQILTAHCRLHGRLIAVAEGKRAALLANDAPTLAALVAEMEGLAATGQRLEQERSRLALALTGEETPAFASLVATADAATGERLLALREELTAAIERLGALNGANRSLVEQALRLTDGWRRLLQAATPATYTPNGAMVAPMLALSGRAWSA